MARVELEDALRDAGDDPVHTRRLRLLLAAELQRGAAELAKPRSGYDAPLTVAVAPGLDAVTPVAVKWRVDPASQPPRAGQLIAALLEILEAPQTGGHEGFLALRVPGEDPEVVAELFDEEIRAVDRLRARALVVPAHVLAVTDLRPLPQPDAEDAFPIAHDDPDPARRTARRILQRLNGMGKWGGYHTEFAHLARGFHGNDAALALEVGETLLAAGLLTEKPSVGQRHVSLNSRRAGEIHRLIRDGQVPEGLRLPAR